MRLAKRSMHSNVAYMSSLDILSTAPMKAQSLSYWLLRSLHSVTVVRKNIICYIHVLGSLGSVPYNSNQKPNTLSPKPKTLSPRP